MTYSVSTPSPAATDRLAAKLADQLRGGDVIELASDLGGGKTTFVQGLARALGYTGPVTSPTFTLSQLYKLPGGLELHHYDLYRLGAAGLVGQELAEVVGDPDVITVIEWAGVANDLLPVDRLRIEIVVAGEEEREWKFLAGGPRSTKLLERLR